MAANSSSASDPAFQRARTILLGSNRDALEAARLTPYVPEGAYYVLADVRRLGVSSAKRAAMTILERTKIASVPGTSFYADPVGETLTRFCFAKDDATLAAGAEILCRL